MNYYLALNAHAVLLLAIAIQVFQGGFQVFQGVLFSSRTTKSNLSQLCAANHATNSLRISWSEHQSIRTTASSLPLLKLPAKLFILRISSPLFICSTCSYPKQYPHRDISVYAYCCSCSDPLNFVISTSPITSDGATRGP